MVYRKGTIVSVRQYAGCVEVTVAGERPGSFVVDNSCFRIIAGCEGTDWIGRPVEYRDGQIRFLDSMAVDEADDYALPRILPFPKIGSAPSDSLIEGFSSTTSTSDAGT